MEESTDFDQTSGKEVKAICSRCGRETVHAVLKSVDKTAIDVDCYPSGRPQESPFWTDHYEVIQCQGCEDISFRHLHYFSEFDDWPCCSDGSTTHLYPPRSENTRPIRDYRHAPLDIKRLYSETIDCFNNGNFTLCAAGLRAIKEVVCSDKGVTNGPCEVIGEDGSKTVKRKTNLEGKIAGLQERGILTKHHSDTLHELRYLGNEALHEFRHPTTEGLRLAIEIVEHTLQQLFELPVRAERLRGERGRQPDR
jgi:hypothetical protein